MNTSENSGCRYQDVQNWMVYKLCFLLPIDDLIMRRNAKYYYLYLPKYYAKSCCSWWRVWRWVRRSELQYKSNSLCSQLSLPANRCVLNVLSKSMASARRAAYGSRPPTALGAVLALIRPDGRYLTAIRKQVASPAGGGRPLWQFSRSRCPLGEPC
jgi:hypothetical protein